jgi:hypothetical protein
MLPFPKKISAVSRRWRDSIFDIQNANAAEAGLNSAPSRTEGVPLGAGLNLVSGKTNQGDFRP